MVDRVQHEQPVCFEQDIKLVNTVCGHNSEVYNVAVGGTYLKYSPLNSYRLFQDFIHKMYKV
jgi:hypothetical protein